MTKVTMIGRPECRLVREAITDFSNLPELLEDMGLKLSVGNISYSGKDMTIKLNVALESYDAGKEQFERSCYRYGLKPEHYGAEFTSNGKTFRLTGLNPRRPKYPISAVRVGDDKPFKFTKHVLTQVLAS